MPTCQGRYAPPEAVALLPPPARTILKYALFYHGGRHLQKILNIAEKMYSDLCYCMRTTLNQHLISHFCTSFSDLRLSVFKYTSEFYNSTDLTYIRQPENEVKIHTAFRSTTNKYSCLQFAYSFALC